MDNRRTEMVWHGLNKVVQAQDPLLSDAQLLGRFIASRDEAAFAVLLQRYGRLVYGVCRNVLRHEHDAEDAFQATFLVFSRRASAIRAEEALGSWLYRVAHRVANNARRAAERQRRRESKAARIEEQSQPPLASDLAWRELQAMLDQEVCKLPGKYRTPFVLCCLMGRSKSEAAAELNWKEGTVSSRLAHARKRLQTRLAQRGVTLSAILSGLAIAEQGGAGVPPALMEAVEKGVPQFLTGQGIATVPATLAGTVLRTMKISRLTLTGVIAAVLGLAGTAAIALQQRDQPKPPVVFNPTKDEPPAVIVEAPTDNLRQSVVRGRVVGADGKPVPRADVVIIAEEDRPAGDRDFASLGRRRVVATASADADGNFQFVTSRPNVRMREERYCLARGTGHQVNWQHLHTLVAVPALELKLETGRQVRGRLVDAAGKPASQVALHFAGFHRVPDPMPVEIDEIEAPAWPAPIVTDADGQFVLTSLPRRCTTYLQIKDERFGPQWVIVAPADEDETDLGTVTLPTPRMLEGAVIAEDTQQPLSNATVVAICYGAANAGTPARTMVKADAAGRFRIRLYPGESLTATAAGAPGTPYLAASKTIQWPAGAPQPAVELRVARGVKVRGQVVEQGTGQAIAGARIQYRPTSALNSNGRGGNLLVNLRWLDVASDANGRFEIVALPGPGHLLVRGPDHDFIPLEVSENELIYGAKDGGKPSNRLYYPDALVSLDLKARVEPDSVVATLRRGITIAGRVETADGKPLTSGFLASRNYLGSGWEQHCEFLPVRDGRFEIPGCDPAQTEPFWFWADKARQGAMVRLSIKDQKTTVRLAPFGSATVRLIDAKGAIVPAKEAQIFLVIRPGREPTDRTNHAAPRLTLDARFQGIQIDPTGRVIVRGLLAGATYVLDLGGGRTTQPFSVAAGQELSLPDVVIVPAPK
ncbi:MAG TPA: sigma-70 family RNA polymerase sigma factor [Gemmataceae bacterium]|nr:sigma-70 family RNA polymerase sigma factor [Gemmataceae bacterium]